jgi:nucleoside-diphosphate-sugar epimerase
MRILVLGGGTFVGRALVEAAAGAGHDVTTLTRSTMPPCADGGRVEALFGDRTTRDGLSGVGNREWDAVFDTWAHAPRVVKASATLLEHATPYYAYVSSASVYREPVPVGANENHPTFDSDPDADATIYPADKRGAELAVLHAFGPKRCLIARAGLILGPHEGPGRLPWWLNRIARGGDVLAPEPRDWPRQYVDSRDLAAWMVLCAERRTSGVFNAVSQSGFTTMRAMLESCRAVTGSDANLVWIDADFLLKNGVEPWTELPIWLPPGPDLDAHSLDTSAAALAGLTFRPVVETVRDTWHWMRDGGKPRTREDSPDVGLDPEKERDIVATWLALTGRESE